MAKFVLDKHSAIKRGLHWDLRFSIPNSKNWASFSMNKFPPLNPGERIYLPRSNDHSEKEALFTGKIPEGEYGAGTIVREDEGECIVHKYTNAHIVIEFKGKKLKGLYHLINAGVFGRRRQYNKKVYAFFKGKEILKTKESYFHIGEIFGFNKKIAGSDLGKQILFQMFKDYSKDPNYPKKFDLCDNLMKQPTHHEHAVCINKLLMKQLLIILEYYKNPNYKIRCNNDIICEKHIEESKRGVENNLKKLNIQTNKMLSLLSSVGKKIVYDSNILYKKIYNKEITNNNSGELSDLELQKKCLAIKINYLNKNINKCNGDENCLKFIKQEIRNSKYDFQDVIENINYEKKKKKILN